MGSSGEESAVHISENLDNTISRIKKEFGSSSDLVVNYIRFDTRESYDCACLYISELAAAAVINNLSLELTQLICDCRNGNSEKKFELLMSCFSGLRPLKKGFDYESLYDELLKGNSIFLIDHCNKYIAIDTNSTEGRPIEEATSQTIVKGPKDAFTENIDKNVFLIRRRIKNKNLRVESLTLGSITHTALKLVYLQDTAKDEIVQELRTRLCKVNQDIVLDGGYIEELIKDDRYTIFPTFISSERPDAVSAALAQGRVAILTDGTPYVITAPALSTEFFQVSEDYYHNFYISSFLRLLRYVAAFFTLFIPALYIAVTTYHQEIIPTPLLVSFAAQREGVPFPAFLEVLIMELTFEVLREAGIRLPKAIGPAISIVGALVLGEAAVAAGIISPAVVIVVSITAISSFAIPNYAMSNAIRITRLALIFFAGVLGLYGLCMASVILTLHLCKLKSVTVPYLTPMAPAVKGANRDTIIRLPLWKLRGDPTGIATNTVKTDAQNPVDPSQKGKSEFG